MEIFIIVALIGLIPALIARNKGRSFVAWWIYGFLLFIVALIHSLLIRPDIRAIEKHQLLDDDLKKCPFCAELIKKEAIKCKHCGSELPNQVDDKIISMPLENSEFLRKAINYRYYDFIDKDSNILISRVRDFCVLCSSYIKQVRDIGGDIDQAEKKVISLINEISFSLNEMKSKEFESLCEKELIRNTL